MNFLGTIKIALFLFIILGISTFQLSQSVMTQAQAQGVCRSCLSEEKCKAKKEEIEIQETKKKKIESEIQRKKKIIKDDRGNPKEHARGSDLKELNELKQQIDRIDNKIRQLKKELKDGGCG